MSCEKIVEFSITNTNGEIVPISFKTRTTEGRVYIDNAKNRKLNRVGKNIIMSQTLIDRKNAVRSNNIPRDAKGRLVKKSSQVEIPDEE